MAFIFNFHQKHPKSTSTNRSLVDFFGLTLELWICSVLDALSEHQRPLCRPLWDKWGDKTNTNANANTNTNTNENTNTNTSACPILKHSHPPRLRTHYAAARRASLVLAPSLNTDPPIQATWSRSNTGNHLLLFCVFVILLEIMFVIAFLLFQLWWFWREQRWQRWRQR